MTIHLHSLKFFAYHGLFEEETISGNDFELNVDVEAAVAENITALSQTVDYVKVYEIIRSRMQQPTKLLETLVQDLADKIHATDNRIKHISISITKMNPPIADFSGSVGVSIKKAY
jgi:7,8-dihydroneopterin aldolase/epimerase/oxygenase